MSTSGAPVLATGTAGVVASTRDATLTAREIELHREASLLLYVAVEETLADVSKRLKRGEPVDERAVVERLEARIARDGLVHAGRPNVAVNAHAVDPLFEATPEASTALRKGDVVVIDVWAKRPGGAYANLIWTAFVGRRGDIPPNVAKAWKATREARDRALAHLIVNPQATGDELDAIARKPVRKAKLERWYSRATARPLGADDPYAPGAVSKPGESRPALAPSTCVAIEPGVYVRGSFATRTAVDVCLVDGKPRVTNAPQQRELRPLLD